METSARVIRARARRAFAGGLPTTPIALRGQDGGPDDQFVRLVIDLALRAGETLLATGASAADTVSSVLRLTGAYGMQSVHVDITLNSITISHHRGIHRDPITVMRIVAVMQQDFSRLERVQELIRDAEAGDLDIVAAGDRLDEITHDPHPYSRYIVTLASMLMGAAVAVLMYGGPLVVVLAAVTTGFVEQSVRWLGARGIPNFFRQVVGGAIPTVVAVVLTQIATREHAAWLADARPSLIVAAGVVILLAGFAAVGAAQDTLDGFYVTASGRTFEVLLLSGGVVAGVVGALAGAQRLGFDLSISPNLTWNTSPTGVAAAGVIALTSGVMSYSRKRTVLLATGTGALAWAVYAATTSWGFSPVLATGTAALVVGVVATAIGFRLHVPSLALATAGIVPLLPGMTIYRGVFELVDRGTASSDGAGTLLTALLIGLAIASGVTLGSLPGRRRSHRTISRKRVINT